MAVYNIQGIEISSRRSLRVLFVGNSLTQDGIAYLPYLLKTFFSPAISFKLYMYYNGGYTLAQQYAQMTEETPCQTFSSAEDNVTWSNSRNAVNMKTILAEREFDIVCLQDYFNYKDSYTDSDIQVWNNCRDYIVENYTGGNSLHFISLFHAPKRDTADSVYAMTVTGNLKILQDTIADDIIPNGMAVYRALSSDLDSLGDESHLSPDGTHTQEGLPCLLQTYVTLLWIFDRFGMPYGIYGLPFKMTTDIYNTLDVPGANLGTGVIEGTDAQNLLAQEIATMAFKDGKKLVQQALT